MTWVKLGDTALDEPFLLDLPRGVVLLHLEVLAFSNRCALDGAIPRAALRKLTTEADPEAAASALVAAGLWTATKTGWQLVWLLDDQPSSAEIHASREQARHRQERKRRHSKGDHTICDPKRCHVLVTRDDPRDGATPPTRPDPPRPVGERGGRENGQAARLVEPAATVPDEAQNLSQDSIACSDYSRHQSQHHLLGGGWVCQACSDLRHRRTLAKAIREAPEGLRDRHLATFERRHLQYPAGREQRNRRALHPAMSSIVRGGVA